MGPWDNSPRNDPIGHLSIASLYQIYCNFTSVVFILLRKEDNAYFLAVHEIADALLKRFENPLLQIDFLFNLSPIGKKFYRAVKVTHNITEKVCSHGNIRNYILITKSLF